MSSVQCICQSAYCMPPNSCEPESIIATPNTDEECWLLTRFTQSLADLLPDSCCQTTCIGDPSRDLQSHNHNSGHTHLHACKFTGQHSFSRRSLPTKLHSQKMLRRSRNSTQQGRVPIRVEFAGGELISLVRPPLIIQQNLPYIQIHFPALTSTLLLMTMMGHMSRPQGCFLFPV